MLVLQRKKGFFLPALCRKDSIVTEKRIRISDTFMFYFLYDDRVISPLSTCLYIVKARRLHRNRDPFTT